MSDTSRIATGPTGDSGLSHLDAHNAIADHLNGHRPCPICHLIVADGDTEDHKRTHVARAIAAR